MRGETLLISAVTQLNKISIHSPHARGDADGEEHNDTTVLEFQSTPLMRGETVTTSYLLQVLDNFNPLPSCEGRQEKVHIKQFGGRFQSTPLMRGETSQDHQEKDSCQISIHSPHARGDLSCDR